MLYPLAYFAYAMIRGMIEGRYAYPFIDLGTHGLAQVVINAAVIAGCFVVAGLALVGLDSLLGGNRKGTSQA
jgi:p-aminobenzoyl-glutamate transporter AbgT